MDWLHNTRIAPQIQIYHTLGISNENTDPLAKLESFRHEEKAEHQVNT